MEKKIFVKKEVIGNYGKEPQTRTAEELIEYGMVNIDKPKGPTKALLSEVPIRFQTMLKRYSISIKLVTPGL